MKTPQVLTDFVAACRLAAKEPDARSAIVELMRSLVMDTDSLSAAMPAMDTHDSSPVGTLGGDVTLFEDDSVTIVLVDTLPHVLQPPHDHLMTAIIGMFEGCEQQRFWSRTADGIAPAAGRDLLAGEVLVIGTDGIHAIGTCDDIARGIHVYLGSLSNVARSIFHPETLEDQPPSMALYNDYCRAS